MRDQITKVLVSISGLDDQLHPDILSLLINITIKMLALHLFQILLKFKE